jgi:hypothetical protein
MTESHPVPRWLAGLTALVLLVLVAAAGFAVIVGIQNLPRIGV